MCSEVTREATVCAVCVLIVVLHTLRTTLCNNNNINNNMNINSNKNGIDILHYGLHMHKCQNRKENIVTKLPHKRVVMRSYISYLCVQQLFPSS